jgi:hypothetical protein
MWHAELKETSFSSNAIPWFWCDQETINASFTRLGLCAGGKNVRVKHE